MKDDFLVFDHVTKRFGALTAVDDVSLTIKKGEFFSLLGPSGCGKTTLLRMLGGFERPDSGRIYLEGNDITDLPPNQRRVHTVFQNYALFPTMTIWDNIAFSLMQMTPETWTAAECPMCKAGSKPVHPGS